MNEPCDCNHDWRFTGVSLDSSPAYLSHECTKCHKATMIEEGLAMKMLKEKAENSLKDKS